VQEPDVPDLPGPCPLHLQMSQGQQEQGHLMAIVTPPTILLSASVNIELGDGTEYTFVLSPSEKRPHLTEVQVVNDYNYDDEWSELLDHNLTLTFEHVSMQGEITTNKDNNHE
jgi:hypothetical protein